ncbi:MAG: TetR family transcriptional regulator [Cellulosilyticum sp.]|nr:TetR family transcriptional regulator [Cellulosilyticum sp.]
MGEKAEYKSAKRSRKLIRTAFAKMMLEKPVDKITVTDIVKEADLNRGTFYAHYQSPYAVLEEIENEIMDQLLLLLNETDYKSFFQDPTPLIIKINHYLEADMDYFKTLIQYSGSEQFLNRLKKLFVSYMENDADVPSHLKETKKFEVMTYFLAGGITELYKRWFHEEFGVISLEELAVCVRESIKDYAKKLR